MENEIDLIKDNEAKEKQKEFYIYPAKLSRRILSYLGDLFICLILSMFIFEVIVNPIGFSIINYGSLSEQYNEYNHERLDIFYENEILFYTDSTKYSYNENVNYTSEMFLKYYVFSKDESFQKYEIFENYWCNIKGLGKNEFYEKKYKIDSSEYFKKYFSVDHASEIYSISLKDEYIDLFMPYYEEENDISSTGETEMQNFKDQFFQGTFLAVYSDFNQTNSDLSDINENMQNINSTIRGTYVIEAWISYIAVSLILFLLIPFLDSRGRTLGKRIMKIERINTTNYLNPKVKTKIVLFFLEFIDTLPILMFIPWISAGFTTLFSLSLLFIPSLITLFYCFVSIIIALANSLNKSFNELITNTIIVDNSLMDDYFVAKGYEI